MGTSRGLVAVEGRIAPWGPRVDPLDIGQMSSGQRLRTTRADLIRSWPSVQEPGSRPQGGWEGDSVPTPELLVDLVAEALQPLLEPRMTVERPFHPSMHGIAGYRHQRHAQEKK